MDVVNRTDEVVYAGVGDEFGDVRCVFRTDEFRLEADEDVDLGEDGAQSQGFSEVGFMAGREGFQRIRVIEL